MQHLQTQVAGQWTFMVAAKSEDDATQGTFGSASNRQGLRGTPRCCPNLPGRKSPHAGRPGQQKPSWLSLSRRLAAARCSPDVPEQVHIFQGLPIVCRCFYSCTQVQCGLLI